MLFKRETLCILFVAITRITLFVGESSAASISPQERRDLVDQRLEDIEEYKKRCKHGEYWSFVVKECKSCESDCPNGTNFIRCGNECRAYYGLKKQAEEIEELKENHAEAEKELGKMIQYQAEEIKELKEIQKKEKEEYGKMLKIQNFLIAGFAVVLFIIFVCLIARCCSTKKKRITAVSGRSKTGKKSNGGETTPLNPNGNQNTQVNISMKTGRGSAESIGVTPSNNKQNESVTGSTSTDTEHANKHNNTGQGNSLTSTHREPGNVDSKAQPFMTECNQVRQPDTATERTIEDENTDSGSLKRNKEPNYSNVVVEENESDVEVTPLNHNEKKNGYFTQQTATVVAHAKGKNSPVIVSMIQQHGQMQNSGNLL